MGVAPVLFGIPNTSNDRGGTELITDERIVLGVPQVKTNFKRD